MNHPTCTISVREGKLLFIQNVITNHIFSWNDLVFIISVELPSFSALAIQNGSCENKTDGYNYTEV